MKAVFQAIKDKAKEYIDDLEVDPSDMDDELVNQVVSKYKITSPSLHLDKMVITPGSEVLDPYEIPEGVPFAPGRPMKVVTYEVPYSDPSRVFHQVITSSNNKIQKRSSKVIAKYVLPKGTQEEEEKISAEARKYFDSTSQKLEEFKKQCNEFNNTGLVDFVAEALRVKYAELVKKKEQIDRLNPYK